MSTAGACCSGLCPTGSEMSRIGLKQLHSLGPTDIGPTLLDAVLFGFASKLEGVLRKAPDLVPVLMLYSDAASTDDVEARLSRVHQVRSELTMHMAFVPGKDWDRELLRSVVGNCGPEPSWIEGGNQ